MFNVFSKLNKKLELQEKTLSTYSRKLCHCSIKTKQSVV